MPRQFDEQQRRGFATGHHQGHYAAVVRLTWNAATARYNWFTSYDVIHVNTIEGVDAISFGETMPALAS